MICFEADLEHDYLSIGIIAQLELIVLAFAGFDSFGLFNKWTWMRHFLLRCEFFFWNDTKQTSTIIFASLKWIIWCLVILGVRIWHLNAQAHVYTHTHTHSQWHWHGQTHTWCEQITRIAGYRAYQIHNFSSLFIYHLQLMVFTPDMLASRLLFMPLESVLRHLEISS